MLGFHGETDEEFNITYENLKEINFYHLHVFKYSQRKGTKAAIMDNQIEATIKEERSKKIIELSNKQKKNFQEKYIGKEEIVLWEQEEGEYIKGHTSNYMIVYAKKSNNMQNKMQKVKIESEFKDGLLGIVTKM